jgi:GTP-binding protein
MDVRFVTSAPNLAGRPETVLPEFAFIGRSNCGKSSLINHFLDRRKMAKISSKPGKTRLLNYFEVAERYYLVDLPGYGFAKVSKQQRAEWAKLIRAYLGSDDRALAVFLLLDIRHKPSPEDLEMLEWLKDSGHPFAIAVTKIDKVGSTSRMKRYREIAETLDLPPDTPFFPTSASKREGAGDMHTWIDALLEQLD